MNTTNGNNTDTPKELWIGLVEVRPLKGSEYLQGSKEAFVNIVTWASDGAEFRRKADLIFGKMRLFVVEIENPEPIDTRARRLEVEEFDEVIEDMLARARGNRNAIIYGTFHTWKRDTA